MKTEADLKKDSDAGLAADSPVKVYVIKMLAKPVIIKMTPAPGGG